MFQTRIDLQLELLQDGLTGAAEEHDGYGEEQLHDGAGIGGAHGAQE